MAARLENTPRLRPDDLAELASRLDRARERRLRDPFGDDDGTLDFLRRADAECAGAAALWLYLHGRAVGGEETFHEGHLLAFAPDFARVYPQSRMAEALSVLARWELLRYDAERGRGLLTDPRCPPPF